VPAPYLGFEAGEILRMGARFGMFGWRRGVGGRRTCFQAGF